MSDLGNREIFSKNLKYYMNKNNITQNDLINKFGFSSSTISDWCNGKKYPRIDKIEMLANYFGIEKSDLIEDREKQKNITPEFRAIQRAGLKSSPEDQKKMYQMLKIAFEEAFKDEKDS